MTWGLYGSHVLFVLLILMIPGPDTAVVIKNSLGGGDRGGSMAALGIGAGNLAQGVAAAFGLSALIHPIRTAVPGAALGRRGVPRRPRADLCLAR